MKLSCQYPRPPERSLTGNARSPESSSDHSPTIGGSPLSTSSATTSQSLLALPNANHGRSRSSSHSSQLDFPLRSEVAQTLTPTEFGLLKHYLEHTSRDLTVDPDDQYTLQVGIPNLAIQSKPLMKSVLALAAVCKCSDIINQPHGRQDWNGERGQVLELLELANQYHMESLREIQPTLPEARQYDSILANAAMMGMYGSASHCTRIWLTRTATFTDQQQLGDSVPKLPQWISLFRAVHIAYVGLLNNRLGTADMAHSPARSPIFPMASIGIQHEYSVSSRSEQNQPRGAATNHPLYPILAATAGSAMTRLNDQAREISLAYESSPLTSFYDLELPSVQHNADMQACYTALAILNDIVADTFRAGDSTPVSHANLALDVEIEPMGQLSEVSPWLRRYTASITSMVPSRLPRRTIMAFIHKVPTRYLTLVEEVMSLVQAEPPPAATDDLDGTWGSLLPPPPMTPEPSIAHQLAMNIFAHWLVLVILLDNVWWIGGIGAWELGRIVASKNDVRWRGSLWHKEDDWWPESMFEVSRQFDKHKR